MHEWYSKQKRIDDILWYFVEFPLLVLGLWKLVGYIGVVGIIVGYLL